MKNLQIIRKKRGLNQIDVAKHIGVDRTTYSNYETGKRDPDTSTVIKLAELFNVSTDFLLGNTDQLKHPETKKETPGLITPEDVMEMAERQKGRPLTADERAELLVRANDLRATLMRLKKESE